jgi:peptidoglycan hydrolase CwlO-like protein
MKGFLVLRGAALSLCALFAAAFFAHESHIAYAQSASQTSATIQSQIDTQDAQIAQLNAEIAQYQAQIQADSASKQTLQTAINSLSLQVKKVKAQVQTTQTQIAVTNLKIQQLGTGISNTQESIGANQAALGAGIRNLQEIDSEPLLVQVLSSDSVAEAWKDADQILQVQNGIQQEVQTLRTQKDTLTTSQNASQQEQAALTKQKQTLTAQQASLTQTENAKTKLLAETNSDEATYQKLLAAAQAELKSFSAFAQNAGGKGILYNQTVCDSWGCYYNQRDSKWGNDPLDGTSYAMKSDGCLVTSMAMVMTHYGYTNVTPITINSNPADFAAYYPAELLINDMPVGSATVTRVPLGTKQANIDAVLATGNPVVVGIHAYGGTHFIVFTSGSKGNYLMRDPYQPNAVDVPFTKYYSLSDIFSASKVVIS